MKDITGYEGKYAVTEDGRVWSYKRGIFLSQGLGTRGKGYYHVSLSLHGKPHTVSVHRLVALAYVPNPENKPTVNHMDGNTKNNRAKNLEWSTMQEQQAHARATGLLDDYGVKNYHAKLTSEQVASIREMKAKGVQQKVLATKFGVSKTAIHNIVTGKKWASLTNKA